MKPTIRDVAEYAGVSVATVSRYLNNSNLVAPKSADRVKCAIDKLKYTPNMLAQGLAKRTTRTVALVIDYSHKEIYSNEFFLKIQFSLEHELARHGYYLMIVDLPDEESAPEILERIILEERIDGVVLLNEMAKPQIMDQLYKFQMPFVIAGRGESRKASWVDIDNVQGGYLAASKLIESGVTDIGFITNSFEKRFVRERFAGFKKAISQHGLLCKDSAVVEGITKLQDHITYLSSNMNSLCEAYIVSDSTIAFNFIKALQAMNISVPNDVQIIAFDNQILAEISDPGITVVDIDVAELGSCVAKILLRNISEMKEDEAQQVLLDVCIIERNSTK